MSGNRKPPVPVLDRDRDGGLTTDDSSLLKASTRKRDSDPGTLIASGGPGPTTDAGDSPGAHVIASAMAAGFHDLAQSIDLKSDSNDYLIAEALDKLNYVLDDTSPQPALHRIADALETIANPTPVGLWIILHERADIPSRVHIAGRVLGRDSDGALWIEWDYGTVWHGSLDLDTEAVDYYATYPAFREALDEIRAEAKERRADERTARTTS